MKRIAVALIFILVLSVGVSAEAVNKFYWASCRTGGGDCLDGVDGAGLVAGDAAEVVMDAGSTTPEIYIYRLYASSASESDPFVIAPDSNPGTLRWHLVSIYARGFGAPKISGSAGDMMLYEANSTDMDGAGLRGPASLTANTSYRGQYPNARATSGNMVLAWTNSAETGTGTPADPYIQAMAFLDLDDYVDKALFDAYTILYADTNNTPAPLTVGASTIVGRKASGGIVALTGAEALAIVGGQAADADLTTYAGITPSANAQTLLGETFAQMQGSLSVDDLITLSGMAEGSTHLGTFTGTTIADNQTVKVALQSLETAVETKANNAVTQIGTFAAPITTNPYTLANSYNAVIWYGATGQINLPTAVAGMNYIIYNTGAFTITINPQNADVVVRDGTPQSAGVSFTLSSGAGNYVTITSDAAGHLVTLGYKGTLVQGS